MSRCPGQDRHQGFGCVFIIPETSLKSQYPIHDLYIEKLSPGQERSWHSLLAYTFNDHLMKSIGLIELIEMSAGDELPAFVRSQADELWILFQGQARFEWRDQRKKSPTRGAAHSIDADSPVRMLVPFGVQFRVSAEAECSFLRVCSDAIDLAEDVLRDEAHGA